MAWITLQPADLRARFAPAELAAFQRAKQDLDDASLASTLAQVSAHVRGYVAALGRGLGAAGSIPEELKRAALDIAVVQYCTDAGGVLIDPKGLRKAAADSAETLLQSVAAKKFAVAFDSDVAGTVSRPGPAIETLTPTMEDDPVPEV